MIGSMAWASGWILEHDLAVNPIISEQIDVSGAEIERLKAESTTDSRSGL
jgi:uncharacterized small protein (DUF1192 family)